MRNAVFERRMVLGLANRGCSEQWQRLATCDSRTSNFFSSAEVMISALFNNFDPNVLNCDLC